MRPTTSTPLAYAFLALADDGAGPEPRTLPRAVAAAAAAVVLAVGVPLGWYVSEKPVGALSAKSALAQDDE
jgi:polygalacturonase